MKRVAPLNKTTAKKPKLTDNLNKLTNTMPTVVPHPAKKNVSANPLKIFFRNSWMNVEKTANSFSSYNAKLVRYNAMKPAPLKITVQQLRRNKKLINKMFVTNEKVR